MIMGRKTFESLPGVLPGRPHIVVTRQASLAGTDKPGVSIAHSLEEAIAVAQKMENSDEIFIVGGEDIYRQSIVLADRMYLTYVQATVAGDAIFPVFDQARWNEKSRTEYPQDAKNQHPFSVVVLEKKE